MKGSAGGKAQRSVHSRNGEGAETTPRDGKQIHRRRESADAAVSRNFHRNAI